MYACGYSYAGGPNNPTSPLDSYNLDNSGRTITQFSTDPVPQRCFAVAFAPNDGSVLFMASGFNQLINNVTSAVYYTQSQVVAYKRVQRTIYSLQLKS